ncbi:MAG: hypothetical protein RL264_1570 [Bacteroidota bacterium]|jgi:ring-1,2-phenylacetyl-CoA epoxidase subunit PaaE
MGLFDIFKKSAPKVPKGFYTAKINITRLTAEAVEVALQPEDADFPTSFLPGQYVNIEVVVDGKTERRSYSLCNQEGKPFTLAIKAVAGGKVSNWFNQKAQSGDTILISHAEGGFHLKNGEKNIVAIAAGSGITPILSIARSLKPDEKMTLFFGNRSQKEALYWSELNALNGVKMTSFFSREKVEGAHEGRIDKNAFTEEIKKNIELLRADVFLICGPSEMIEEVKSALTFFGVQKDKIRTELFTPPTENVEEKKGSFSGTSKVKVILDGELCNLEMQVPGNGKTVLEEIDRAGLDAPFSCRGGVCSSCKAKVTEGEVMMRVNYSLTDEEVKKGYVLTCQCIPQSENVTINFDA